MAASELTDVSPGTDTSQSRNIGLQWLIQPVLIFFPLPRSLREQAINILDAYLQRRYVKSSEKEMHFIYLLPAPEHSESTGLSVLSIMTEFSIPSAWDFFLCPSCWHDCKEDMFEFSSVANCCLFRIVSLCHIDLLFQIHF